MRRVWVQNFAVDDSVIEWRRAGNLPPSAHAICSPFDSEARYSIKRQTTWTGYKVHFTETCDSDTPHLIVHVVTTPATEQDNEIVPELHQALAEKDALLREHLLDQGYSDSHDLITAHATYRIEMLMPMRTNHSWQAQTANGYALRNFRIDWVAHTTGNLPRGQDEWLMGAEAG